MTINTTPNLGLPYPDGNELVANGPTDYSGIVNILDAGGNGPTAALFTMGTLASRPGANTVPIGRMYFSTDTKAFSISDGSSWHTVPLDTSTVPPGFIGQWGGSSDPVDSDGTVRWMVCDGRAISRTTYATCFANIGTTYGAGDGSTTFNIPNGRGRFALGKAASGTGATLGGTGGSLDHTHPLGANTMVEIYWGTQAVGGPGPTGPKFGPSNSNLTFTSAGQLGGQGTTLSSFDNLPGQPVTGTTDGSNPAYIVFNFIIRVL